MIKCVVLSLGNGDLNKGFPYVTADLWKDGTPYRMRFTGSLPAAPRLLEVYRNWRLLYDALYKRLGLCPRIEIDEGDVTNIAEDDFSDLCQQLRDNINAWLNSKHFRSIEQQLRTQLDPSNEIWLIIETENDQLRRLPWHLWNFFEDYPKAIPAFSISEYKPLARIRPKLPRTKVKILAILGNSTGLDIDQDRDSLEQSPDAEVTFLKEPSPKVLDDQLWITGYDILFFAGHSDSQKEGEIHLNRTDSLTIKQLRYAVSKAIERGLQLAIFNSCDGLGLARDLADLQIPLVIVMREPIPDVVAHVFLKHFLAAYRRGDSAFIAVQEARQRLQKLEPQYPCATWLPTICLNPAVRTPTWQDLGRILEPNFSPYRGLFAFRQEDAPFFFGREAFTELLVDAVQKQPLVAVIGSSGSGKSSVVFAGLIPQLDQRGSWHTLSLRPGDRPLNALAGTIIREMEPQLSQGDRLQKTRNLVDHLRQNTGALRDVVDDLVWENLGIRILLVIDQFEELYTLCRDTEERQIFLDRLLEAATHTQNFTLVITLRADFLGQALSYRPLADALQYTDLKLGPMTHQELQDAIAKPVEQLGMTIEDGLTERILNAISAAPGDLPLLEFAMTQLWEKQKDSRLTHATYEEIGGVEEALARYAEEAYSRLNEEEKERAKRIFVQLVRPGDGTEDTRRLATAREIGQENWDLVTLVANARLVVSNYDEVTNDETVEIVHEALIGGWQRLRQWIEEDRTFLTWLERLRFARRQWETSNQDEGALLRGVSLAEAEGWLKERPLGLSPVEKIFIERSRFMRGRQRQRLLLGLTSSLVIVLGLAGVAGIGWQQADISKNNLQIRTISASSESLFNSNKELEALIESLKAAKLLKQTFWAESDTKIRVITALQQTVYGVSEHNRLEGHSDIVNSVSFSPDGKIIASVSKDNTIKLWSRNGNLLKTIKENSNALKISFSPDSKTIASVGSDKFIKLWNLDGTLLKIFPEHSSDVTSISFSPEGWLIVSGNHDGTVNILRRDGTLLKTMKGHSDRVLGVSFSPDGQVIASGSGDQTIKLWSQDGNLIRSIKAHNDAVTDVSFSPNGQVLASASWDGTVKLWSLDGKELKTLRGHTNRVTSVSFSPDGQVLVSASFDTTVKLWLWNRQKNTFFKTIEGHSVGLTGSENREYGNQDNLSTLNFQNRVSATSVSFSPDGQIFAVSGGKLVQLFRQNGTSIKDLEGHSSLVTSVSFSPDGKMIASSSRDLTVKLWNRKGREMKTLWGHGSDILSVNFSSDSRTIASSSWDGTIKLWSLDGKELRTIQGDHSPITKVSFSPDGKLLAAASTDNTIRLWSQDGKERKALLNHRSSVLNIGFSPDGEIIASAGNDGSIKLWKKDGTLLKTLQGHTGSVTSVSFSPDGEIIASAGNDGAIKLWKKDGTLLTTLQGHKSRVLSVSFSPNSKTLTSVSDDNTIILWDFDLDNLLAHGCTFLDDYLKNNSYINENASSRNVCDGVLTF